MKTTLTFRLLNRLHLIESEEKHGKLNPISLIWFILRTTWRRIIFTFAYKAYIFEFAYKRHLRPMIWRALGCKVGKRVHIGHGVRLDFDNAERITIEDDVVLANGVTLLCHRRDITGYHVGMNPKDLPMKYDNIHLSKGCYIGMNATILSGVNIGEGAIIGSCALVTKDIPAWNIAVGVPAKVNKTNQ